MAGTHESITFSTSELKGMLNTRIIQGNILALAGPTGGQFYGTATVDTDAYGAISNVPIFYHCERATTIESGWTAFNIGDDVVVLAENAAGQAATPTLYVLGFWQEEPHTCSPFLRVDIQNAQANNTARTSVFFVVDTHTWLYANIPGLPFPAEDNAANRQIFDAWVAAGHAYLQSNKIYTDYAVSDRPIQNRKGQSETFEFDSAIPNWKVKCEATDTSCYCGEHEGASMLGSECCDNDVVVCTDTVFSLHPTNFTQHLEYPAEDGRKLIVAQGIHAGEVGYFGSGVVIDRECVEHISLVLANLDEGSGVECDGNVEWTNASRLIINAEPYSDEISADITFSSPLGGATRTFSVSISSSPECLCTIAGSCWTQPGTQQLGDSKTWDVSGCLPSHLSGLSDLLRGTWVDSDDTMIENDTTKADCLYAADWNIEEAPHSVRGMAAKQTSAFAVQLYIIEPAVLAGPINDFQTEMSVKYCCDPHPSYYDVGINSSLGVIRKDDFVVDETIVFASADKESSDLYNPFNALPNGNLVTYAKTAIAYLRSLYGMAPNELFRDSEFDVLLDFYA